MSARHVYGLTASTLFMLGALVACTGSDDPAPSTDPVVSSGPTESQGEGKEPTVEDLGGPIDTLVTAEQSDFETMISVVYQSAADGRVIDNINYEVFETGFDCGLTYGPGLYESWEWAEDNTVLKVKLREDLTWGDGKPVTGHDIAFTYELIGDAQVASPRIAYIEKMVEGKRPLVVDDFNVEFHFTTAYRQETMMAHAAFQPLPKHLLESADRATLRGNDFGTAPVVNGPWKIDQWDRNAKMVLVPNDKYTGPVDEKARLKRIIIKVLPEYSTRLVELENGAIDLAPAILPPDADRLAKEHPEISLYRRGWRSQDYVAWNQLDSADYKAKGKAKTAGTELDWADVKPHWAFGDRDVRRALTKAIDVDKLIGDLLTSKETGEVYGKRAVSTITPSLCDVHNNDITPIPHNAAEARKELEALGWTDSDGDGILDKDGQEFSFTLLTNSGNPRRAKGSIIIQANLKAIGVDMQIEQVESNTFFERLRKKDYEAALSGWSAGLFPDMTDIWHSGDHYEFNFTAYSNPEVDRLVKEAVEEFDPVKSNALFKEAQALIYEDQGYTFLYWFDEIVGVHSRFKDAKVDILSTYRALNSWWVPQAEAKFKK